MTAPVAPIDVARIERESACAFALDSLRDLADWLAANAPKIPEAMVMPGITYALTLRPADNAGLYNCLRWLFTNGAVCDYSKLENVLNFMRRDGHETLTENNYSVAWAGPSWLVERQWGNQSIAIIVDREMAR